MPRTDIIARRAYQRSYYARRLDLDPEFKARHLDVVRETRRRLSERRRAVIAEFRADGCALCDETAPCCMSAHHLDPSKKDFSIGRSSSLSAERLRAELKKCACLCENCRRKVHAGVVALERAA